MKYKKCQPLTAAYCEETDEVLIVLAAPAEFFPNEEIALGQVLFVFRDTRKFDCPLVQYVSALVEFIVQRDIPMRAPRFAP